MQRRKRILLVTLILFQVTLLFAQYEREPRIGDNAPSLHIQEWVKGEAVTEFGKDRLYVVEFSGTWCVPCRKAIPHLSELSLKYRDRITFISVYLENNNKDNLSDLSYIEKVKYLITALGNKVDFTVAVDVPQQTTKTLWKINAVPSAFVIGKSGIIIWKGDPLDLDPVLYEVEKGIFDKSLAHRQQEDFKLCLGDIQKLRKEKQFKAALHKIDSLIIVKPLNDWVRYLKFETLTEYNVKDAYLWLQYLLDSVNENFDWSHFIGYGFSKIPLLEQNYELKLKMLERSIAGAETNYIAAYQMFLKAETYAALGNYNEAVVWCEKAIENNQMPWLDKTKKSNDEDELFKTSLVMYKYQVLLDKNRQKAGEWIRSLANSGDLDVDSNFIAALLNVKQPDYILALDLTNDALNKERDILRRGNLLGIKSKIYGAIGDLPKAIEWCQLAIVEYNKTGGSYGLIKRHERMLAEYKQRLGGG